MVQLASSVETLLQQQRDFFDAGRTQPVAFRIEQLQRLKQAVLDRQNALMDALRADLRKPQLESFLTEIGVVQEIDHALKRLKSWAKPQRVSVSLQQFPASAQIYPEPLGVALIISPWNYPVQLAISPLVGAIAAGNCVMLKPSEIAPHTSSAIASLIAETFDPAYICAVEGGVETSQDLLSQPFDHIFFTGSTHIGKVVMEAAAKHLTPVTLELGGKSPCIVDADTDLETTARRIAWGKFINAGQTCIAPDYLLVDRTIKPQLLERLQGCIREFYGDDPAASPDFARIVSDKHFQRLSNLLGAGKIIAGGETDADSRYIAPTIIDLDDPDVPVMADEIFGPILPVLEYNNLNEAIAFVNQRPKPLALYLFSRNHHRQEQVLQATSSGGVCINDTVIQVGVPSLPFGGVGHSGMGAYHGKASFDTFSHYKSVLRKPFWLDLKWRYAPYADKLKTIKKLLS
jgi:acyl-CoA reductase-like NAD-dependent aldehyde dehydrogenase